MGLDMLVQQVRGGAIVVVEEEDEITAREEQRKVLRGAAAGVVDAGPGERQTCGEVRQHALRLRT